MLNFVILILFCLVPDIFLSDPTEDINELPTVSSLERNDELGKMNTILKDLKDKITKEVLEEVFKNCEETLKQRRDLEIKLVEKGRVIKRNQRKTDPSLIRMKKSDPLVRARETSHLPFDEASYLLYRRFNLSRDDINKHLPTVTLAGELSSRSRDNCMQLMNTANCRALSPFRTAEGLCNNLQNPTWGSALSCQQRLLPAYYEGNSRFRTSVYGGPLPAPRTLSLNLHYHYNRPTDYVTHMYMFFGQFLDHDITLTPPSTTVDNQAIECCPPEDETHPQCAPIIIPNDDPFYSQFGVSCLNFVRSAICPTCTMGARQQMNQVTAFIDASFIYGNSDNETASLRMNDGTGRLRMQRSRYGDLLPPSSNPEEDQCSFPETNEICFESGDSRVNQHTVLTSLHTIFLREHNRIASQLRVLNPHWDEERIFQEARRIVGAQMQTIVYKEYLPITLGNDRMSYFRLKMGSDTRYDSSENPTMMIEFTSAAFRFGHSLINSLVAGTPLNTTGGRRLLRNEFFQPFDLYRGFAGSLVRGASDSPAQFFDRHLVPDVTNYLYRVRGDQTGLDLASININRGRDHGVPTYVDMVRHCSEGEIVINSFSDLVNNRLMQYRQANALQRNYRSVQDVDLWPGILMETPNAGAVVGPTAACIIGLQFYKLKYGDRFYVEHVNQAGSFTYQQLKQLRRITLSQIICMNTDVYEMPLNAMIFNSRNNPMIQCKYVKGVDLSYWKEY